MKLLDTNKEANQALVQDDDGTGTRYVALDHAYASRAYPELLVGTYLEQAHYIARAHVAGMVVSHVDPMVPGWEKFDAILHFKKRVGQQ